MSKDEAQNISLRELVRMQLNAFEEHKRESTAFRDSTTKQLSKMCENITKIETHAGYTKTTIDEHDKDIKSLKGTQNWLKGAIFAIAGLGGILEYFNFKK